MTYIFFEKNGKTFFDFTMQDSKFWLKAVPTQGFIEVDTAASPEEKHVANMQINGWDWTKLL